MTGTAGFRVGMVDGLLNTRLGPSAFTRLGYWSAVAARADSYWVPDHLNSLFPRALWKPQYVGAARLIPRVDAYLEPWTMLGHLAARNRVGRLRLGTCVTDVGRRNPAVTAQGAATLHLLTRGKAILGLGTGERVGNEPYGVEWSTPVARFEEALATIRALWGSRGELVSRESAYFPLRDALFDLPPYKGKWPPIWVASHGPRMLRATGRYADGWFPTMIESPKTYATGLDAVRSAASDAGRDPAAITPALLQALLVADSRGAVEDALHSTLVKASALNASAKTWARHGLEHPMGPRFAGLQDFMPQSIDEPTLLRYTAGVPESLSREVAISGTPDEVIDQVAEWRDHGLRHMAVVNFAVIQPHLRAALASNIPFMKVLRGLRKL